MRKRWSALAGFLCGVLNAGCGAVPIRVAALDQVEEVRVTEGAKEGAEAAPEMYAHAERERDLAKQAHAAGDNVGATLHAERAMAAYEHTLVVARFARATYELADAEKALNDTVVARQSLDATRVELERQAEELSARTQVLRDRLLPAASGAAPAERDAARRTAAGSMVAEARLLCSAARLVATDADGLSSAESDVTALSKRVDDSAGGAAIDDAARARARCLDVLTRARRKSKPGEESADTLLSELSGQNGWDPARDERGIVVTLRDAYRGDQLTDGAAAKLKDLGRVAAAHPAFGVQVVVHDAKAPLAKDTGDARRADAAIAALVAGGAKQSHVDPELVGARAPTADPTDSTVRQRNERLEIVFVAP